MQGGQPGYLGARQIDRSIGPRETPDVFLKHIGVAIAGARVGAKTGRAFKLLRLGRERDALLIVRQCVDILARNDIYRNSVALEAALATSVLMMEELALKLGTAGAPRKLVEEAAQFYRTLGDGVEGASERANWLEWRMAEPAGEISDSGDVGRV
jgi:hypothetical protein